MTNKTLPSRQGTFRGLPSGIWALGMVSLFMDASSEMIHSLLPVYMTTVLGAGLLSVGAVEGIAEATAAIMKLFSGVISDYFKRRKLLAVIGYGLSALCKPLFPLATSMIWVFAARFADRIGKGIREAPRDALIAAITPQEQRGAAYGLRQALDSAGAFVGPVLAVVLMTLLSNNIRACLLGRRYSCAHLRCFACCRCSGIRCFSLRKDHSRNRNYFISAGEDAEAIPVGGALWGALHPCTLQRCVSGSQGT